MERGLQGGGCLPPFPLKMIPSHVIRLFVLSTSPFVFLLPPTPFAIRCTLLLSFLLSTFCLFLPCFLSFYIPLYNIFSYLSSDEISPHGGEKGGGLFFRYSRTVIADLDPTFTLMRIWIPDNFTPVSARKLLTVLFVYLSIY